MPHDGHHHHHHHHHGHNHGGGEHLHSHPLGPGGAGRTEELQTLAASFIDGFRQATDKASFLRVAGVPFQRPGADGLTLNLVDAEIRSAWQVGSASPGFASKELVYMPFPGEMIAGRENMTFVYVSMSERLDVDLLEVLAEKL